MYKTIADILKIIGVFCAYFAAAKFGLSMPYVGSHIALIWLPTGIAVAALIRFGLLVIPSIFAAAFLVDLSISSDIALSAAIAIGNTLAPLSAYIFLEKVAFDGRLIHRKDTVLLIFTAFLSMLISSAIGSAALAYFGVLPNHKIIDGWLRWWVGDSVGVLLAAPLLLTFQISELKNQKNYKPEKIIWFFTLIFTASVLFLSHFKADTILQFAFLFIPFIVWGSLRFSIQFSSFAVMVLAIIASYGASLGQGVFASQNGNSGLILLWSFVTATAIINLLVNALMSEIKEAQISQEIQNEKLTEQSRTLEEMNVELEAINEELAYTNSTITAQAAQIETEKKRYEIMMQHSSDGILIVDFDGNLIECSQRASEMLGYEKDELLKLSVYDLDFSSKERVSDIIKFIAKQPTKFETTHKRKNGSLYDAEITASLIELGEKGYIYAAVRDITEKKAIERERESLLELFDKGDSVLFRWNNDKNWSIKHVSENVSTLTGYTKEEFLSLQIVYADIIHKEDIQRVISEVSEATTQNLDFFSHEPYRIIAKNGDIKWVLDHTVLQKDGDSVTHYLGYISDITNQHLLQDAIVNERNFISTIINNANAIIAVIRSDGIMSLINEYGENFTGYSKEEITATPFFWSRFLNEEKRDKVVGIIEQAKAGKIVKSFQNTWISKTGEERMFEWSNALVTKPDGSMDYLFTIGLDVSKQKMYEEELEKKVEEETAKHLEKERLLIQQSRMAAMGEMISNIAHQWRQPLNQISALKDELIEDYYFNELDNDKIEFFKQRVGGSLQYMSTTIDDFRNFFKPDKEKTVFAIADSIGHTLSLLSDSLKSVNITVKTDINLDEAKAFGYPNEFSQALINILNNAKDALKSNNTATERRINLSASIDSGLIRVYVEDNAGGIPDDIINKIFDPYFTTKHKSQGTGLGLYMSKMLIEQSFGGRLTVANQNGGACFLIEIKVDNKEEDR